MPARTSKITSDVESPRTSSTKRRIIYEGKTSPRYTNPKHARNGEMKRAEEQRKDEVSVQKLRGNHDTIQRLTSHLKSMQEQMNSVNDSGEFQEVESNHSGRLSHVPSQPAMIPSSRSMLSRDKRLPLHPWNTTGLQENVLGNQCSTFGLPRNPSQGIHYGVAHETRRETESVPRAIRTGTSFARDDEQNQGTIPMPTFATKPLTTSSAVPVEFPQNYMVGQQRQQISELQFDKFPNSKSFLVWKFRFKTQVTTCSDSPTDAMLWIKEVEMVDSLEELKSSRSVCGKDFPNFEMLDAKIASALFKIIQNSHFKKKVSLEEQTAQKEDRVAFMKYEYFRVTGAYDTVVDYADFSLSPFMMIIFRNSTRGGTKFLLSMSKIPSDDVLERLHKLRIRESARLKVRH